MTDSTSDWTPAERAALEEWTPMLPAEDFVDRVMNAEVMPPRRRAWVVLPVVGALVAAVTLVLALGDETSTATKEAIAPVDRVDATGDYDLVLRPGVASRIYDFDATRVRFDVDGACVGGQLQIDAPRIATRDGQPTYVLGTAREYPYQLRCGETDVRRGTIVKRPLFVSTAGVHPERVRLALDGQTHRVTYDVAAPELVLAVGARTVVDVVRDRVVVMTLTARDGHVVVPGGTLDEGVYVVGDTTLLLDREGDPTTRLMYHGSLSTPDGELDASWGLRFHDVSSPMPGVKVAPGGRPYVHAIHPTHGEHFYFIDSTRAARQRDAGDGSYDVVVGPETYANIFSRDPVRVRVDVEGFCETTPWLRLFGFKDAGTGRARLPGFVIGPLERPRAEITADWGYYVGCKGKLGTGGTITLLDLEPRLAWSPRTATIDADGRPQRVTYWGRTPRIQVRAKDATSLDVTRDGVRVTTIEIADGVGEIPRGMLGPGRYDVGGTELILQIDERKDHFSPLQITSLGRQAGSVDARGFVVPGWTVFLEGVPAVTKDGQFFARAPSTRDTVLLHAHHPRMGDRYYLVDVTD